MLKFALPIAQYRYMVYLCINKTAIMKKIFTKSTIKYLLRGWVGIPQHYRDLFETYREICGDDINAIHSAISGYAVVHTFGRNVNISEFRSREAAVSHLQQLAELANESISKRDTYFANRTSSWDIVRL